MKIFPFSDPILLPLAPAITSTIADYLQSIAPAHCLNSLDQNCTDIVTELPQNLGWQWQFQRSIRQIPIPQYQYVSTIAHRLAAKSVLTPVEICQSLYTPLPALTVEAQSAQRCVPSPCLNLECWYTEAGYIYFQILPEAIAIWLNYIHDLPIDLSGGGRGEGGDGRDMSTAIYAHARCCSLLRLADREQLVTISASWQISQPYWLQDLLHQENRLTGRLDRFLDCPVEQRLIQVLMTVLDGIYSYNWLLGSLDFRSTGQNMSEISHRFPKPPNWTKLTIDLAQSWLEFHRHCQVFGDFKSQHPRLAIARCGLTAISRRYLELLLTNYLGVDALIGL